MTYCDDHAMVFFVRSTATEESDDQDSGSNDDD